jgi:hypothetical protein
VTKPEFASNLKWAVQWSSRSRLDGDSRHFMWDDGKPLLFRTRRAARERIRAVWGYIKNRPDLRAEPHGWRMPRAVRVYVVLIPVPAEESRPPVV